MSQMVKKAKKKTFQKLLVDAYNIYGQQSY